jgi:hypothetical protein
MKRRIKHDLLPQQLSVYLCTYFLYNSCSIRTKDYSILNVGIQSLSAPFISMI